MQLRRAALALIALLLPGCSREPTLEQLLDDDADPSAARVAAAERDALRGLYAGVAPSEVKLVLGDEWLTAQGVRVQDGHVVALALVGAFPREHLAALPHLQSLHVARAELDDFRQLGPLPELATLAVDFSRLSSLDGLAECCPRLRELDISQGTVRDLAPLAGLDSLEHLRLAYLDLPDLTSAPPLPSLHRLVITGGPLASLEGLDAFDALHELLLFGCQQLTRLDSLPPLSELRQLELQQTKVAYLGALPELPALERIETSDNALLRLQLPGAPGALPALRELELHEAELVSVELGPLPSLESVDLRGEGSLFDSGRLRRLVIATQPRLTSLDARRNHLQDLAGLAPQPVLAHVRLDHNPLAVLEVFEDGFPALRHVSVRRTRVAELPGALQAAGVVMSHDEAEVEANAWEAVLRQAFEARKGSFVESLPVTAGSAQRLQARCTYAASTFSTPRLNCSGSIEQLSGLVYLELVSVDPLSPAAGGPNTWPVRASVRTRKGRVRLYVKYEADFRGRAEALAGYRDPEQPWFQLGEAGNAAEEPGSVSGYAFAEATPGQPGSTSGEAHLLVDRLVVWIEGEDAEGVEYVLESPNP